MHHHPQRSEVLNKGLTCTAIPIGNNISATGQQKIQKATNTLTMMFRRCTSFPFVVRNHCFVIPEQSTEYWLRNTKTQQGKQSQIDPSIPEEIIPETNMAMLSA